MTSSGHVTSSGTCLVDSALALSYRLLIGNIPLSGLVSEIFRDKDVIRPRSTIREDHIETPYRETLC